MDLLRLDLLNSVPKRRAIKGLRRLNTLQLSQGFTDLFSVDMLTSLLAMQGEQCKELFTKGGSTD